MSRTPLLYIYIYNTGYNRLIVNGSAERQRRPRLAVPLDIELEALERLQAWWETRPRLRLGRNIEIFGCDAFRYHVLPQFCSFFAWG